MVGEFLDSVWGLSMLEQHRRLVDAHTTDVTIRLEASLWGCHEVSEIALVVDSSGSMKGSWNDTLEWMKNLVDAFEIDGTRHRMGVIMWSNNVIDKETILFSENLTG